jgi:hypothetical protein
MRRFLRMLFVKNNCYSPITYFWGIALVLLISAQFSQYIFFICGSTIMGNSLSVTCYSHSHEEKKNLSKVLTWIIKFLLNITFSDGWLHDFTQSNSWVKPYIKGEMYTPSTKRYWKSNFTGGQVKLEQVIPLDLYLPVICSVFNKWLKFLGMHMRELSYIFTRVQESMGHFIKK